MSIVGRFNCRLSECPLRGLTVPQQKCSYIIATKKRSGDKINGVAIKLHGQICEKIFPAKRLSLTLGTSQRVLITGVASFQGTFQNIGVATFQRS